LRQYLCAFWILVCAGSANVVLAQTAPPAPVFPAVQTRDAQGGTTVRAIKLSAPLTLDGKLDEAIYRDVPPIGGFIQVLPDAGQPATERTDVWISFDDENVYVSARLWQQNNPIIANELRHDRARQNDEFGAAFDTFYDRQTGFLVYTTPIGAMGECQVGEAQGYTNCDYNAVWDARAGRFEGGWTAEIKIPFKTLRYRPGASQVWGVNLRRTIRHRNETVFLTKMPITAGGGGINRMSYAGTLVGIEVPAGAKNLDVKPYGISRLTTDRVAVPATSQDVRSDFGVDVKYGLTQNLTADFTYNTDFAQVEADDQQVNLTRFNQTFPEKREFFLESAGIFSAPGAGPPLFFSRQIGLARGRDVPILGGTRLTGKVGRFSMGALNITTDEEAVSRSPRTNFTVLRMKRDVLRRSAVGGTFTNRSQSLIRPGEASQAYGLDAGFRLFDDVEAAGFFSRAETPGAAGKSSYGANFGYTPDAFGLTVKHLFIDDSFNPEVGFVRRDDIRQTIATGRLTRRPAKSRVRRIDVTGTADYIYNTSGLLETYDDTVAFETEFHSSDRITVSANRGYDVLLQPFAIAPAVTVPVGSYVTHTLHAEYGLGPQKRYTGNVSVDHGGLYGGHQTVFNVSSGRLALTTRLAVEPSIALNWIDLPYGSFKTQLYRNRVTYMFTPRMFASAFVQYNSTNSTFSTNLRMRWEYSPGSELFIVYTDDENMNPLTPNRSAELLTRAFVVKMNRLFRF
jgi:hypothetical protein